VIEPKENIEGWRVAEMYFLALKSEVTRDKYKRRLENFFNFVDIEGKSFHDKCDIFLKWFQCIV